MSFWSGIADFLGLSPVDDFGDVLRDAGSLLSGGMYNARDNSFGVSQLPLVRAAEGAIDGYLSQRKDDLVSSTMGGSLAAMSTLRENGLEDYVGDLFQTDADAALDQATVNDQLAEIAWKRSEDSADKALERARELRRTYYADLMQGLKDAGLNPVLAASGGFGGVSSSAPMGTSTAATSSKAEGLNAANLIQSIATIVSASGSLLRGLNPTQITRNYYNIK